MRFVCVFEAVYVCVCAGQSKTGSIVKAFETLLTYWILCIVQEFAFAAQALTFRRAESESDVTYLPPLQQGGKVSRSNFPVMR